MASGFGLAAQDEVAAVPHRGELSSETRGEEANLLAPFHHIADVPGKNFRGQMIDAFNRWLAVDDETLEKVKAVVDKLHNSSLLIDDIQDNSKLRRGVPVAHSIYGTASTINSANYVYFLAMRDVMELGRSAGSSKLCALVEVFCGEMCNLHSGQGRDIWFRDERVTPTEEEYFSMVRDKTGGLFRLGVGLLQQFSNFKEDFNPLVNTMGAYFQILDDYLNLRSDRYHKTKEFCEDLSEGKFSFVVIHSIHTARSRGDDNKLEKLIRKKPEDVQLKKYALELMEATGSFEYTLKKLNELKEEVLRHIDALGGNRILVGLIETLHSQTLKDRENFSF